jgi:hypothetical protein
MVVVRKATATSKVNRIAVVAEKDNPPLWWCIRAFWLRQTLHLPSDTGPAQFAQIRCSQHMPPHLLCSVPAGGRCGLWFPAEGAVNPYFRRVLSSLL